MQHDSFDHHRHRIYVSTVSRNISHHEISNIFLGYMGSERHRNLQPLEAHWNIRFYVLYLHCHFNLMAGVPILVSDQRKIQGMYARPSLAERFERRSGEGTRKSDKFSTDLSCEYFRAKSETLARSSNELH